MQSSDLEALGALAAAAAAGTTDAAAGTHAAIATRVFDTIGPAADPVRRMHDGISRAVYRTVRAGVHGSALHGSRAWARNQPRDYTPLDATPAGLVAVGAVNGIWGDYLVETQNALAQPMTLRPAAGTCPSAMQPRPAGGGPAITADAPGLAAAYPEATGRVAVFLHGLCETELAWNGVDLSRKQRPAEPPVPFGDRLRDDLDFTAVYVRFNSGARISQNGRDLSALLDQLVHHWPVHIDELVLIGHSLGGLVARSACHYGEIDGWDWTERVRHVFCLGSPHLGADLEKGVHLLDWALGQFPETRALGGLLRRRSVGVKDLRFGAVTEADWDGHDPDEFLKDRCQETPFLPSAHYYFVGAQLSDGPLGRALGDLLVRDPSASGIGRSREVKFKVEHGLRLTGLNHFDLLTHPDVYAQLRSWIERVGFAAAAEVAALD